MKSEWFDISHRDGVAKVRIFDSIGAGSITHGEFVSALGDDAQVVDLSINSHGGCGIISTHVHNVLKERKTIATINGVCGSGAVIIAMAAETIRICRGSRMMLHSSRAFVVGTPEIFRFAADMMDKFNSQMALLIQGRTEQPAETVAKWINGNDDHWFTAEQAVELGLADELIDPPKPRRVPAVPAGEVMDNAREKLFLEFLEFFSDLQVPDKAKLGREIGAWFTYRVSQQEGHSVSIPECPSPSDLLAKPQP